MQSILQYRRFGSRVKAQYERDKAKAKAVDEQSSESTSPTLSTSTTAHITRISSADNDVRDPEKAGQAHTPLSGPLSTQGPRSQTQTPDMPPAAIIPTHHSIGTTLGTILTGIDVRDRTTNERSLSDSEKEQKVFVVGYEGEHDILNPHNWSYATRIWATINIAFIGWVVGFASSVDSAALVQAAKDLGVSEVTESMATGLFLIGFGVGMRYDT